MIQQLAHEPFGNIMHDDIRYPLKSSGLQAQIDLVIHIIHHDELISVSVSYLG